MTDDYFNMEIESHEDNYDSLAENLKRVTISLMAAVSLLNTAERKNCKPSKAFSPFNQVIRDYNISIENARKLLIEIDEIKPNPQPLSKETK